MVSRCTDWSANIIIIIKIIKVIVIFFKEADLLAFPHWAGSHNNSLDYSDDKKICDYEPYLKHLIFIVRMAGCWNFAWFVLALCVCVLPAPCGDMKPPTPRLRTAVCWLAKLCSCSPCSTGQRAKVRPRQGDRGFQGNSHKAQTASHRHIEGGWGLSTP